MGKEVEKKPKRLWDGGLEKGKGRGEGMEVNGGESLTVWGRGQRSQRGCGREAWRRR